MSLTYNTGLQLHVNAWLDAYKRAQQSGDTAGMEAALRNLEAHADYMDDGVCNGSFSREDALSEFDIEEPPQQVPQGDDTLKGGGGGGGDDTVKGGGGGRGDDTVTGGGGQDDDDDDTKTDPGVKQFEAYSNQLDEETLEMLEAKFAGDNGWSDDEKAAAAKFIETLCGKEIDAADKQKLQENDELQAAAYDRLEKELDDTGKSLLKYQFAGPDNKWDTKEKAEAYEYLTKKYGHEISNDEQKTLINDKDLHANRFDKWWGQMTEKEQQRIMEKYNNGQPLTEAQKDRASRDLQVICGTTGDLTAEDLKEIMNDKRLDKDSKENIAPTEFEVGKPNGEQKPKEGGDKTSPADKTPEQYAKMFDDWESSIDPRTRYMLECKFRGNDGTWQPGEKAAAGKFIAEVCGEGALDQGDLDKLANNDELHAARFHKWYDSLDESQKQRIRDEYADGRDVNELEPNVKTRASKEIEEITGSYDDIDNTDKDKIAKDTKYLSDGGRPRTITIDDDEVSIADPDQIVGTESDYLKYSAANHFDYKTYRGIDYMLDYATPEEANSLFRRFDVDKSGYLDKKELAGLDRYCWNVGAKYIDTNEFEWDASRFHDKGSRPNEALVEFFMRYPEADIVIDDPETWDETKIKSWK